MLSFANKLTASIPHFAGATAAVVTVSALLPGSACAVDLARPNIVFILADDAGLGDFGYTGQKRFNTPNIDRLAAQGMVMTNHYAGAPVCAPSRATLMTGLHTGHVSVRANHGYLPGAKNVSRIPLARTDLTIAERLKDVGYSTAMIGKWGLGEEDSYSAPWMRGWDFFYGFVNQDHAPNHYPEVLYRNNTKEVIVQNYGHAEKVYANDRFTNEGLAYMTGAVAQGQPFFLYMAYTTPHSDLVCPADTVAQLKKEQAWARDPKVNPKSVQFAAMVMRLDRDVGRLMDKLDELGVGENTLVVFTSDNGPHAADGKDNAFFNSAAGLRGIKGDLYEGGVREPFIARWTGRIAAGTSSDLPAAFWDFTPTVLDILGQPAPAGIDGISYAPTLLGRAGEQRKHAYLYWEYNAKKKAQQSIREGNWKAIRMSPKSPVEVYDLAVDPSEKNDLSAQYPVKVEYFKKLMKSARVDTPVYPLEEGGAGAKKAK